MKSRYDVSWHPGLGAYVRVPENDRERAFLLGESVPGEMSEKWKRKLTEAACYQRMSPNERLSFGFYSWPMVKATVTRVKTYDERGHLTPAAIGVLSAMGALRRVL